MHLKLVEKHTPARYASIANAAQAMDVLRREMYGWYYKDLAVEVGVSPSCIMAIRSGRTAWPRAHTFFGLIRVLDLEMRLEKK